MNLNPFSWLRRNSKGSPELLAAGKALKETVVSRTRRALIFRRDRREAALRLLRWRSRGRFNWKDSNTIAREYRGRNGGRYAVMGNGQHRCLDPRPYEGKSGRREELAFRRQDRLAAASAA